MLLILTKYFLVVSLTVMTLTNSLFSTIYETTQSIDHTKINNIRHMGISINLYRVKKAEKLEDIDDLENQIVKAEDTKVDLYKITGDLATIFLNTTDPFNNHNTIPCRMLYGRRPQSYHELSIGDVGGFIPSSEIPEITQWIKTNKINTYEGFSKMYESLSTEVKKELEAMATDDKVALFNGYVRPLCVLYFTALENRNSVVFVGQ